MPDGLEFKINIPDFTKRLEAFDKKVRGRIVLRAANKGAQVFKHITQSKAPVQSKATSQRRPGLLKRSIIVKKLRYTEPNEIVYSVAIRRAKASRSAVRILKTARRLGKRAPDAFYWYFLEHGWMPRGPGGKLRGGNRSRALQRTRNRAAGNREISAERYHFMKPAFDVGQNAALLAVIREMDAGIAEENRNVK